jgi:hypothetical protein
MSEVFASEKKNILETGIRRAKYFQTDETGARHNGQNYYMSVSKNLCMEKLIYY